eukprot:gene12298-57_t
MDDVLQELKKICVSSLKYVPARQLAQLVNVLRLLSELGTNIEPISHPDTWTALAEHVDVSTFNTRDVGMFLQGASALSFKHTAMVGNVMHRAMEIAHELDRVSMMITVQAIGRMAIRNYIVTKTLTNHLVPMIHNLDFREAMQTLNALSRIAIPIEKLHRDLGRFLGYRILATHDKCNDTEQLSKAIAASAKMSLRSAQDIVDTLSGQILKNPGPVAHTASILFCYAKLKVWRAKIPIVLDAILVAPVLPAHTIHPIAHCVATFGIDRTDVIDLLLKSSQCPEALTKLTLTHLAGVINSFAMIRVTEQTVIQPLISRASDQLQQTKDFRSITSILRSQFILDSVNVAFTQRSVQMINDAEDGQVRPSDLVRALQAARRLPLPLSLQDQLTSKLNRRLPECGVAETDALLRFHRVFPRYFQLSIEKRARWLVKEITARKHDIIPSATFTVTLVSRGLLSSLVPEVITSLFDRVESLDDTVYQSRIVIPLLLRACAKAQLSDNALFEKLCGALAVSIHKHGCTNTPQGIALMMDLHALDLLDTKLNAAVLHWLLKKYDLAVCDCGGGGGGGDVNRTSTATTLPPHGTLQGPIALIPIPRASISENTDLLKRCATIIKERKTLGPGPKDQSMELIHAILIRLNGEQALEKALSMAAASNIMTSIAILGIEEPVLFITASQSAENFCDFASLQVRFFLLVDDLASRTTTI